MAKLFDSKTQIPLSHQLSLVDLIPDDVFPNSKSLMEFRIKKHYIDEATLNDGTSLQDLVQALIFLNEHDYGKLKTMMDLIRWIKTRAIHNDSDLIEVDDITQMLEIYCIKYQFKISTTIERKVEQSLRNAASKEELRLS